MISADWRDEWKRKVLAAMPVRAKFVVTEHTIRKSWKNSKDNIYAIKLSPVTGGSKENDQFYEATPGGSIELQTVTESVGQELALGKFVYVDFTLADETT